MHAPITPTEVFANAAGTLLMHPAGYGIVRYHPGNWQAADLTDLLTRFGQLLSQRNWHYALTDARQLPTLSAASKQWLENHWVGPEAKRPQPLYMALVQPSEVFSRLAVAQMQAKNYGSTHYTYFDDEAMAHTWQAAQLP